MYFHLHARPHHTGHADTRKGVAMREFFEISEFIYISYRIINVICNVSVWLFLIWTIKVLLNKNTSFKNKIMKIHFGKLCLILYSMNLECVEEIKKICIFSWFTVVSQNCFKTKFKIMYFFLNIFNCSVFYPFENKFHMEYGSA